MPGPARLPQPPAAVPARREVGPSLAKLPLDALLTLTALRRALIGGRYDAVHSHEEGGLIGVGAGGAAARAAPVRHALEPAAAADQLRVQPLGGRPAVCSG